MPYRTIVLLLFSFVALSSAQEYQPNWQAVLTTDTDIVFSIKLPKESYENEDYAEFPVRISHPDGLIEEYAVKLWRSGEGCSQRDESAEAPRQPEMLDPESPLGLIHKRVFYPKQFQEWDDTLRDMGPRHEELLEMRNKENDELETTGD